MPKRLTSQSTNPHSSLTPLPPNSHIPTTFSDNLPLPKLFVFDLDYTLWPFWVDTHVSSPLKPVSKDPSTNTAMLDRTGESFAFYNQVPGILHAARAKGITMALASRTHAPDLAEKMLRGIVVPIPEALKNTAVEDAESRGSGNGKEEEKPKQAWEYFTYREIFPGSKIRHFNKIQSRTRKSEGGEVAFSEMVFFDDEGRNREVETQLGVTFVLVRDGVTIAEVDRGVREWRKRNGVVAGKDTEGGRSEL